MNDLIEKKEEIIECYENKLIEEDWKIFIETLNMILTKELLYMNLECKYFD